MKGRATSEKPSWVIDALLRDWGTKIVALLLALVVFVFTRDEVKSTFAVPLNVREDPDRVLLTNLPASVDVVVRGPWTRVNTLSNSSFRAAVLDLRRASPGPLEIDPASVVMPPGVLLERVDYDRVDLRFEDIIERQFPVIPRVVGDVHVDHEQVAIEVEPQQFVLRGPRSTVQRLQSIETETLSVGAAVETVERDLTLLKPADDVEFAGRFDGDAPHVHVRVSVRPRRGERRVDVAVASAIAAEVEGLRVLGAPVTEQIIIEGPVPMLRRIADHQAPLLPHVEIHELKRPPKRPRGTLGSARAEVRIVWADDVPDDIRKRVQFSPTVTYVNVPVAVSDEPNP